MTSCEQDPSLIDALLRHREPQQSEHLGRPQGHHRGGCQGAEAAIVQLLFAYDSGDPTNKSSLFKMLP